MRLTSHCVVTGLHAHTLPVDPLGGLPVCRRPTLARSCGTRKLDPDHNSLIDVNAIDVDVTTRRRIRGAVSLLRPCPGRPAVRSDQSAVKVQRRCDSPGSNRPNCRPGKWLAATSTSLPSSSRVIGLSHRVGEILVVVDEKVEVVVHQLEWAMNDVPEQHGVMVPV